MVCYRPVEYFSRQKQFVSNNLFCICVFPCYHRRGYGTFSVDFTRRILSLFMIAAKQRKKSPDASKNQLNPHCCDNILVATSFKELFIEEATVGWASLNMSFTSTNKSI
ncbi:hypothetical protein KIN20_005452 [Parelaphostrongylus tenuis]|uniref:MYST-type HAT domain-containing protein n=1 Tax=Parelaphostrongylus tenuis TaxID=148309 RepID=A0AAD5QF62_PARTN|nr:hypothetical protein KIN20_005452 [Parelaphostrongylus tenuis]